MTFTPERATRPVNRYTRSPALSREHWRKAHIAAPEKRQIFADALADATSTCQHYFSLFKAKDATELYFHSYDGHLRTVTQTLAMHRMTDAEDRLAVIVHAHRSLRP